VAVADCFVIAVRFALHNFERIVRVFAEVLLYERTPLLNASFY
jgi:hypothetical protein